MRVGDLVKLRNCSDQGTLAIITTVAKSTHLSKANPGLRLYWILIDDSVKCFTGNQLVPQ